MAPPTDATPPRLRHPVNTLITPGERLGNLTALYNREKIILIPGKGTYVHQGNLYASLLGKLCARLEEQPATTSETVDGERWVISIQPRQSTGMDPLVPSLSYSYRQNSFTAIHPRVGDVILGRVTKVNRPNYAIVDILAIVPEPTATSESSSSCSQQRQQPLILPVHEPYSGTLRQNQIRPNSSIEVEVSECFCPSDVILARIHARGEKDYILSTAEPELGVIWAKCESSGKEMRAVSWKEMQCIVTGVKEARKVAKPRLR